MSYLEYFELTEEPFSNAPVSRFYLRRLPSTAGADPAHARRLAT